jgi:LUD domain
MSKEPADSQDRARIERVSIALEQRGVHVLFISDRQAALAQVLELIPAGASVTHGASTSLCEIGLIDYLGRPNSPYRYLNSLWRAENDAAQRTRSRALLSVQADCFLGSVQAITDSGQVVSVDATGSRSAF